jgi:hypothetical protein
MIYNFDDKIKCLEKYLKIAKSAGNKSKSHLAFMQKDIDCLSQIIEDLRNLKFTDSGYDW